MRLIEMKDADDYTKALLGLDTEAKYFTGTVINYTKNQIEIKNTFLTAPCKQSHLCTEIHCGIVVKAPVIREYFSKF
jgi:hypothetical protein